MWGLSRLGKFWLWAACGLLSGAESKWIQGHLGAVEIYSDGGSKAALEKAGTFEEFRFALGTLVGNADLQSTPPFRILALKNPSASAGLVRGRDRMEISLSADDPIPEAVFREATKLMLQHNVARLPDEIESGLVEFFSTIEVHGVRVSWGAPPAKRTRDWARIQLLATKPEYYGKFKVLMFNLRNGVADAPAYRNSIGKTKAEFEAELDAYLQAGVFLPSDGPSRPLNAQREVPIKPLEAADAELALADLLNADSRGKYEQMLKSRRYSTEANEGLALMALRDNDAGAARQYLKNATDAGSKNGAIWLAYALQEDDRVKSNEALDQALDLDSNLAEAHYEKGFRRHIEKELKRATVLEPRVAKYWDALAQVYLDDNRFAEAGRAWRAAEQAAVEPAERARMHNSLAAISTEKLDFSDSERKRTADEKAMDLQRVKDKAAVDLHKAEARINKAQGGSLEGVPVVAWEDAQTVALAGLLKQVDCLGKKTRASIETGEHLVVKLSVTDRRGLICGPQKGRAVTLEYYLKPDAELGTSGEIAVIPR